MGYRLRTFFFAHAGAMPPTAPATRGNAGGAEGAAETAAGLSPTVGATNLGAAFVATTTVLGGAPMRGGAGLSLAVAKELAAGRATAREATAARAASMSPMSTRPR